MTEAIDRKEAERVFHNERFGEGADVRDSLGRWYVAIAAGARLQIELVRRYCAGGTVLEYGCADGRLSLEETRIAQDCGRFHGIDISDKAIERARAVAAAEGLSHCRFQVMDAERMDFPSGMFDVVFGRGIIHHLDLAACFGELARVLRPGGRAIFYEPMGHNPLINGFRRRTPHLRTPDEHPLLMGDFRLAKDFFGNVRLRFFGLATLAAVPFAGAEGKGAMMTLCQKADDLILRIPGIRRNAWHVLMVLTR